jgi:hypothetical protein
MAWGVHATTNHSNWWWAAPSWIQSVKFKRHRDNISIYLWCNFRGMAMKNRWDILLRWFGVSMQQPTTQIDGEPFPLGFKVWNSNGTEIIYQSTCGVIFVAWWWQIDEKYYCDGSGGLGFGKCNNPPLNVGFSAPLNIQSLKIWWHRDSISIYAWINFCGMMMIIRGDIDDHLQGINKH